MNSVWSVVETFLGISNVLQKNAIKKYSLSFTVTNPNSIENQRQIALFQSMILH